MHLLRDGGSTWIGLLDRFQTQNTKSCRGGLPGQLHSRSRAAPVRLAVRLAVVATPQSWVLTSSRLCSSLSQHMLTTTTNIRDAHYHGLRFFILPNHFQIVSFRFESAKVGDGGCERPRGHESTAGQRNGSCYTSSYIFYFLREET